LTIVKNVTLKTIVEKEIYRMKKMPSVATPSQISSSTHLAIAPINNAITDNASHPSKYVITTQTVRTEAMKNEASVVPPVKIIPPGQKSANARIVNSTVPPLINVFLKASNAMESMIVWLKVRKVMWVMRTLLFVAWGRESVRYMITQRNVYVRGNLNAKLAGAFHRRSAAMVWEIVVKGMTARKIICWLTAVILMKKPRSMISTPIKPALVMKMSSNAQHLAGASF
jgi:hypothetical protein